MKLFRYCLTYALLATAPHAYAEITVTSSRNSDDIRISISNDPLAGDIIAFSDGKLVLTSPEMIDAPMGLLDARIEIRPFTTGSLNTVEISTSATCNCAPKFFEINNQLSVFEVSSQEFGPNNTVNRTSTLRENFFAPQTTQNGQSMDFIEAQEPTTEIANSVANQISLGLLTRNENRQHRPQGLMQAGETVSFGMTEDIGFITSARTENSEIDQCAAIQILLTEHWSSKEASFYQDRASISTTSHDQDSHATAIRMHYLKHGLGAEAAITHSFDGDQNSNEQVISFLSKILEKKPLLDAETIPHCEGVISLFYFIADLENSKSNFTRGDLFTYYSLPPNLQNAIIVRLLRRLSEENLTSFLAELQAHEVTKYQSERVLSGETDTLLNERPPALIDPDTTSTVTSLFGNDIATTPHSIGNQEHEEAQNFNEITMQVSRLLQNGENYRAVDTLLTEIDREPDQDPKQKLKNTFKSTLSNLSEVEILTLFYNTDWSRLIDEKEMVSQRLEDLGYFRTSPLISTAMELSGPHNSTSSDRALEALNGYTLDNAEEFETLLRETDLVINQINDFIADSEVAE